MKPKALEFFKKWARRLGYVLLALVFLVVMLEIFYRNQWIDTYKRELNALNPGLGPSYPQKKLLVMGDSFSAAENSWVNVLRKAHPDWQIVNSAVPGTSIYQANLMLGSRIQRFQPDLVILQVYVGNDLFDLRYPTAWGKVGWGRSLYWGVANHLRSLAWLNYALGQVKRATSMPDFQQGKENGSAFDPARFSERERIYLRAEPDLITGQALLTGDRRQDMDDYLAWMAEFIGTVKAASCPLLVVVVPHCAQVNVRYAQRMALLGAKDMGNAALREVEYPFWKRMQALQGDGVECLNLLPALQDQERAGRAMYYLHDAHLNDEGQQLMAEIVDLWLKKRL